MRFIIFFLVTAQGFYTLNVQCQHACQVIKHKSGYHDGDACHCLDESNTQMPEVIIESKKKTIE